jgi:putative glutamine amidotransferase
MTNSSPPLIGITADLWEGGTKGETPYRESGWFLPLRYCRALESAGAVPLVLAPTPSNAALHRLLGSLDGLLISGGNFDIHPSFFGEKPIAGLGTIKQERTEFELQLTAAALKKNLPILGICGGAQAINVVLGGTLYQDIGAQMPGADEHEQGRKKIICGHKIDIREGTRLKQILQRRRLEVNTTHHQAVKALGHGLAINAVAPDGIIEGIESTQHSFVLGVQWHPEVLAPRRIDQRRIFTAFVKNCGRQQRRSSNPKH